MNVYYTMKIYIISRTGIQDLTIIYLWNKLSTAHMKYDSYF